MLAKSYQSYPTLSDPFKRNGKMYITIQMKSGSPKDVRWYTEQEYSKLYPDEKVTSNNGHSFGSQRDCLGFTNGYITIFKGGENEEDPWFKACKVARHCRWWGWYVISTEEVPTDLPNGVIPIQLKWEDVGNEAGYVDEKKAATNVAKLRKGVVAYYD